VMFAPHHQAAADELVRVCRPGRTLGLLSWTPEGMIGDLFRTMAPFAPPPPLGAQPPPLWGSEEHLAELFGDRVHFESQRREHLEITAFTKAHDYGRHFKAHYRPAIAARANAERNGERRSSTLLWTPSATERTEARRVSPASRRSTCSRSATGADLRWIVIPDMFGGCATCRLFPQRAATPRSQPRPLGARTTANQRRAPSHAQGLLRRCLLTWTVGESRHCDYRTRRVAEAVVTGRAKQDLPQPHVLTGADHQ
jgi:hypothetical protein